MGPIEVEGTLMAADKQAIKETTGVVQCAGAQPVVQPAVPDTVRASPKTGRSRITAFWAVFRGLGYHFIYFRGPGNFFRDLGHMSPKPETSSP